MAGGILDLKHPMIPEAQQGRYSISAKTDRGEKLQQGFELREYGGSQSALGGRGERWTSVWSRRGAEPAFSAPVLPKYEVKVHLPAVITILDRQATFRVCGK